MNETVRHRVAIVLVTHNGARWLPALFEALPAALAHRPVVAMPDHQEPIAQDSEPFTLAEPLALPTIDVDPVWIAVDTGSVDGSGDLARAAGFTVLEAETSVPFGRAISIARTHLSERELEVDWLWLLHDDCVPGEGALLQLIGAAEFSGAPVSGPMILSWSHPARVLQRGIRLTGSGRRDYRVDPGELDQGQHDDEPATAVLAVNSAGMLVRREVWDQLGGYDPAFPMSGDDIDFCRRAHRAGHEVVVVPRAKLRHAQALTNNRRPHSRSTRPVRDLRLAALHLHLAHATAWALPFIAIRLVLGTALKSAARLLRRDVIGARDEIDGLLRFLAHPSRLTASRHRVAAVATVGHQIERRYRVPAREQLRYWARAVAHVAEVATRVAKEVGLESSQPELVTGNQTLREELWFRLRHRPAVFIPLALTLLLACATVNLWARSGPLQGELLPGSAESALDLVRSYTSGWHDISRGTTASAPAWLLLLAIWSIPVGGNVSTALALLFSFFPVLLTIAFTGATRGLINSVWVRVGLGFVASTLGVFTQARDRGDFATLFATLLLLPAVRFAITAAVQRRANRSACAGLLFTGVVAFAPMTWLIAFATLLLILGFAPAVRTAHIIRDAALVLVMPWVLLLPTSIDWIRHPYLLAMSAGTASGAPAASTSASNFSALAQFLSLSPAGKGLGFCVLLTAIAATARGVTPRVARSVSIVLIPPVLAVVAAALITFRVPGVPDLIHPASSMGLAIIGIGCSLAIAMAADGFLAALRSRALGWRHVVAGIGVVALSLSSVMGLISWVAQPSSTLTRGEFTELPAFIAVDVASSERPRVLTLRVSDPAPVQFSIASAATGSFAGPDLLRASGEDQTLSDAVAELVAQGQASATSRGAAVQTLVSAGIRYVILEGGGQGSDSVASAFVATPGVRQLAAADTSSRWWVWQLAGRPARASVTPLIGGRAGDPRPLVGYTHSSAYVPGEVQLRSNMGNPALNPATIRLADATDGWRATVDSRAVEVTRTDSGTVVVEVPGGARNEFTLTWESRTRSAWLALQAVVFLVMVIFAAPSRRPIAVDDGGSE